MQHHIKHWWNGLFFYCDGRFLPEAVILLALNGSSFSSSTWRRCFHHEAAPFFWQFLFTVSLILLSVAVLDFCLILIIIIVCNGALTYPSSPHQCQRWKVRLLVEKSWRAGSLSCPIEYKVLGSQSPHSLCTDIHLRQDAFKWFNIHFSEPPIINRSVYGSYQRFGQATCY